MRHPTLLLVSLTIGCCLLGSTFGWFVRGFFTNSESQMVSSKDNLDSTESLEQKIYVTLRSSLRNGLSIDEVADLVGEGMFVRDYEIPESMVDTYESLWESRGVTSEPEDEYCAILIGSSRCVLHFRDDKLVNLLPDVDFGDPEKMVFGVAG